jgi:predicted nucleic acid-binding Zn ribbon protein
MSERTPWSGPAGPTGSASPPPGDAHAPGAVPAGPRPPAGPGQPRQPGQSGQPGTEPAPEQPTGVDLARVALRAAKEEARARGALVQQKKQARRGGLRSGARADGRDPVPLGSAISRLISDRAWEAPAAVGGVMGRWPQIVGDDLAHHCVPLSYDDDPDQRVLTVQCDSTAWATQVRLLAPQLLARLNQDLGQGTVQRIKVQGPHAPTRRFGPLRAPGSRGPGDTYG